MAQLWNAGADGPESTLTEGLHGSLEDFESYRLREVNVESCAGLVHTVVMVFRCLDTELELRSHTGPRV